MYEVMGRGENNLNLWAVDTLKVKTSPGGKRLKMRKSAENDLHIFDLSPLKFSSNGIG